MVTIVKLVVVVFLMLIMPATAYSFIRFRIEKKAREYGNLINILKIIDTEEAIIPRIRTEYAPADYILPVLFASLISFAACLFLMFGGELASISVGKDVDSILLSGMNFSHEIADETIYRRSLAVLITAMMGGYVMAAQNVIRRLLTMDLTPGTYYSAGLRIVFAALVALMVSFIIGDVVPPGMLSGISFLIGIFPERGLKLLLEKVKLMSEKNVTKSDDLPLEMIEGISYFHRIRLNELGIDNAQNLAESSFLDLVVKTPFTPNQILDWIGQAILYTSFKGKIVKLRDVGIRNIFDYLELGTQKNQLQELADLTEIPELSLRIVHEKTVRDDQVLLLKNFSVQLNNMTQTK